MYSYLDSDVMATVRLEDSREFDSVGYKQLSWKRKDIESLSYHLLTKNYHRQTLKLFQNDRYDC